MLKEYNVDVIFMSDYEQLNVVIPKIKCTVHTDRVVSIILLFVNRISISIYFYW